MKRFAVIFGARPSAVKLAPVVRALFDRGAAVDVCLTGQHGDMLDVVLGDLGLDATCSIHRFQPAESSGLPDALGHMLVGVSTFLGQKPYDGAIVVGDTLSGLAGALGASLAKVPVAHVEAGLRTHRHEPWPEEQIRRQIDACSHWHFAPTTEAMDNLLLEELQTDERTHMVGNTIVDSLRHREVSRSRPDPEHPEVLITLHRRENWPRMGWLAAAVCRLALRHPEVSFTWPVHPNPRVSRPIVLAVARSANVEILPALDYATFTQRLAESSMVITDSGGVQEEAATLGVPALIVRETTERPESVEAGVARLVGADFLRTADELLSDPIELDAMSRAVPCFGDGLAGARIADYLVFGKTEIAEFRPEVLCGL